jgi:hypothetical protein
MPLGDGFAAVFHTRLHAIRHCNDGTLNVLLLQVAPRTLNEST